MKVRYFVWCLTLLLLACSSRQRSGSDLHIIWKDKRAIGLSIDPFSLQDISSDSVATLLSIHVLEVDSTRGPSIFGDVKQQGDSLSFYPLIPLTPRKTYEVSLGKKPIGRITIPPNTATAEVTAIFPSQDTLPQNILKLYFRFSTPMREGESAKHIFLLQDKKDTMKNVFLDLQPELWNEDRTVLTIWFDPGRIKRELQPNRLLGQPLKSGKTYSILVDKSWADIYGNELNKSFNKEFFVSERDSLFPDPNSWKLKVPRSGTNQPLAIFFQENLDYFLATQAISIEHPSGKRISGNVTLENEESVLIFTPEVSWEHGDYVIRIQSRLEDLAANNLNHPFDRDLKITPTVSTAEFHFKKFTISP